MSDVYICHSPADIIISQKLRVFLENNGFLCSTDSSEAGSARVFLLIHSKSSASSEGILRLLSVAAFSDKTVTIPYMADDTPLEPSFEFYLTGAKAIKPDISNNDYAFDALLAAVDTTINGKETDAENTVPAPQTELPPAEPTDSGQAMDSAPAAASEQSQENSAPEKTGPSLQDGPTAEQDTPPAANPNFDPSQIQYNYYNQVVTSEKKKAGRKRVVIISSIIAGAAVVAAAAVIVILMMNNRAPVEESSAPAVSENAPSETKTSTLGELELSLQNLNCTGTYTGEVNENGKPDGNGVFEGKYTYNDKIKETEYEVNIIYKGRFSDGQAVDSSGKAVMNEDFPEESYMIKKEYTGSVRNGLCHGHGKLKIAYNDMSIVSDEYDGEWENDVRNGNGTTVTTFPNGDKIIYDGDWENDCFSGNGTFTMEYAQGDTIKKTYIGGFRNNMFNGKGICTYEYKDGSIGSYNGEWTNDELTGNGTISIKNTNGDLKSYEYVGEIYESLRHGSGKETTIFRNGDKIINTGEWILDKQNGEGTEIHYFSSGDIDTIEYKGNFKDGKHEGKGKCVTKMKNGDVETKDGNFTNGELNGKGTYSVEYKTGNVKSTVYEGEIENNIMKGKGTYTATSRDGQTSVFEGTWSGYTLNGTMTKKTKDGKLAEVKEGLFKNMVLISGTIKTYDENGKLLITETFGE